MNESTKENSQYPMQTIHMLVWMLHKMHEPKPYSPDDTPGALGQQFDECTAHYLNKVRLILETPEGERIDAHAESIMRKKAAAERLLAEREPISDKSVTTYGGEVLTLGQLKQRLHEALNAYSELSDQSIKTSAELVVAHVVIAKQKADAEQLLTERESARREIETQQLYLKHFRVPVAGEKIRLARIPQGTHVPIENVGRTFIASELNFCGKELCLSIESAGGSKINLPLNCFEAPGQNKKSGANFQ